MPAIRNEIRFILNDQLVELNKITSSMTLLDYLRLEQKLCGTKEGCAEGDCGACTVLVGRVSNKELVYETVNACIRFVGSLDGCHIVTIEHLKSSNGQLHPVQKAMVDHHGSQCGFCTPGFVMSLYALWMNKPNPTNKEVETALQGNLCRCTGYEPIVKAAQSISDLNHPKNDPLVKERKSIMAKLSTFNDGARVEIETNNDLVIVPASVDDLASARKEYPDSTIVAGSTDVGLWVTKNMRDISPLIFISHLEELHNIETTTNGVSVGACVTYTEMQPVIEKYFPALSEYWNRIGGEQVRNMGTVGGNIANGSPIGDTPPALIVLGATITLRCAKKKRTIPLEDFFIDYGKQDRQEGDFIEALHIPYPAKDHYFRVYKVSKRRDEDISAVCAAFNIYVQNDVITSARIAFGGMAATPKRARRVEDYLIGKSWSEGTILEAATGFDKDFTPLNDWRASSEYRSLVAKNLLLRFFMEASGGEDVRLNREAAA